MHSLLIPTTIISRAEPSARVSRRALHFTKPYSTHVICVLSCTVRSVHHIRSKTLRVCVCVSVFVSVVCVCVYSEPEKWNGKTMQKLLFKCLPRGVHNLPVFLPYAHERTIYTTQNKAYSMHTLALPHISVTYMFMRIKQYSFTTLF